MSKKKNKNLAITKESASNSFKGGDLAFIILLFVSVAAMVTILSLSMQYSSGMNEQAVLLAETYSEDANNKFLLQINSFREKTSVLADLAGEYKTRESLNQFLTDIPHKSGYENYIFTEIRYFCGEKEYSQNREGEISRSEENIHVLNMRDKDKLSTYGIIYEENGTKASVVCYCPVRGSDVIDGIALFFKQDAIISFIADLDGDLVNNSEFQALCCANEDAQGAQILSIINDKSKKMKINDSFFTYLSNMINDTGAYSDTVKHLIEGGKTDSALLELQNEKYIVSVGHANENDQGLYVISLYHVKNVYTEGYDLISTIITIMAIFAMVMIIFAVYFFITRRKLNLKIEEINMINTVLDCPTLLKFERNARDILDTHRNTKYVVVVSHVQHFTYIANKFGANVSVAVLKHLKNVIYNSIGSEETYGYIADGEFVFLLMYYDESILNSQLVSMRERFRALPAESVPPDCNLTVSFGVYIMNSNNYSEPVSKMVDKAMSVRNETSLTNMKQIYNQYTPTMENTRMRRAEIESCMEKALADGEFRVFYQPKYSLESEDIDGAEVLVRWYDAERKHYRRPDEFLPVFEENGFISKLDRQVYYTACETLADWSTKGRRTYPISVNVSRVTAIQEDFINYYIAVKKKFNIPNDFITLEFTESFAYENYDHLGAITQHLRSAGFLCSIDDFGTGSSTFSTLQNLDMDEIKLDRFFIIDDPLPEKNKIILKNVIDMGKELNLKVTQEGVETREYVKMLREMGCEVIQGYYFAKPMGLDDYEKFIDDFVASGRILGEE